MKNWTFSLVFAALALLGATPLADAEPQRGVCVDRARFIEKMQQKYAERQVSYGINYNGQLVEVLVSGDGSFTIMLTRPDGTSCLIASGRNWQNVAPAVDRTGI